MEPQLATEQVRKGKSAERQSPRFKVDFSVKVSTLVGGPKAPFQGRAHDLGEGGLSIYVPADLEEGQQVQLEFLLPFSRRPLEAQAIVRGRNGYRYALQFKNLTRAAMEEISRTCRALFLAAQ